MSGNLWDFIKISYRIKSITGFVIVAGISITLYGLVVKNYLVVLFGLILLLEGRTVWRRYIDKYTKPNSFNQKTYSGKSSHGKSNWPQFSEQYQKLSGNRKK